ncbi:MAG: hypothetical protein HY709_11880 [Candidatus Latescibacteria bacterium]|nr:hypothetical protein [Candidatus Latescibacterota bacterium]
MNPPIHDQPHQERVDASLRRRLYNRRTGLYRKLRKDGEISDDLCRLVAEVLAFVGEAGDEWLSHTFRGPSGSVHQKTSGTFRR